MMLDSIMTKKVYSLKSKHTILDAASLMKNKDIGAVPIVDDQNHILGIVTDRDLVLALAKGKMLDCELGQIMSKNVESLYPDQTIAELCEAMGYRQVKRIPIIDFDDKLIGIISLGDLSSLNHYDSYINDIVAEISYNPSKNRSIYTI